jgi:sortase A
MIVKPNEVSKLQIGYDKPYATLITCTPLGTAEKRLLVVGEQISPSPSSANAAPTQNSADNAPADTNMAGKSPTVLERLFGAR